MMSVRRSMNSAHSPRSMGELLRTIHLRNRHTRLHADWVFWGMILLMPWLLKYWQMATMAE